MRPRPSASGIRPAMSTAGVAGCIHGFSSTNGLVSLAPGLTAAVSFRVHGLRLGSTASAGSSFGADAAGSREDAEMAAGPFQLMRLSALPGELALQQPQMPLQVQSDKSQCILLRRPVPPGAVQQRWEVAHRVGYKLQMTRTGDWHTKVQWTARKVTIPAGGAG